MKKIFTILIFASILSCNTNSSKSNTPDSINIGASDAVYTIQQDQSELVWTGRELSTSSHYGTIDFQSGQFEINDGLISSGEFIVDMTTINNQDLPEDARPRLEGHLKSDDFFSVESHPTATLTITGSQLISEGVWNVTGNLTIKGFTHPVEFEMLNSENGWAANLVFDRSKYDVRFRSGTFFQNLGDKLIFDEIELAINFKTS
tara:strand:+ start:17435 stop:18046 length:612 start_codon:yes stop_codon:yes gene_type:complete